MYGSQTLMPAACFICHNCQALALLSPFDDLRNRITEHQVEEGDIIILCILSLWIHIKSKIKYNDTVDYS